MIGAGIVGGLCELVLAINHSSINGIDLTPFAVGLSIGWWLYLLSAIAIIVGGVMALRNPQALTARTWQYPAAQYPYNQPYPPPPAQYPPYSTTGQSQYPPYTPQYPADPELYQATEPGQQYGPTERRSAPRPARSNIRIPGLIRNHTRSRKHRRHRRRPIHHNSCRLSEILERDQSPSDRIAMNASCGISTLPTIFMRFLPSFCFSSSLRLREMSPP